MERYSHGHHSSVLRAHGTRTAENSCGYLLPYLRAGLSVLDVGCGPGSITLDLAARVAGDPGDEGTAVGVDAAPKAVEAARAEAARRGDDRTTFTVADATALPWADGSFDVVHAHQVLQHVPDPVAVLREMARVARPGGLVAARDADYGGMIWAPESGGMSTWLATYRKLARRNGGEPDAGRRLRAWAREAGLAGATVGASLWTYTTAEETSWWGEVWAERALSSDFAAQARETGLLDDDGLRAIADAWRGWGRSPDAWFAMPHGELLARLP